jgi:hypothetical protein
MGGKENKMKKQFTAAILAATVVLGATFAPELVWQQPHHYQLYIVKSGDTLDDIILKANQGSNVSFDVRDAESYSLSESKKMEGGANSYLIHPGDKVAVPIYK